MLNEWRVAEEYCEERGLAIPLNRERRRAFEKWHKLKKKNLPDWYAKIS
jgi:hypothetical protein